jgi:hypothetical protein
LQTATQRSNFRPYSAQQPLDPDAPAQTTKVVSFKLAEGGYTEIIAPPGITGTRSLTARKVYHMIGYARQDRPVLLRGKTGHRSANTALGEAKLIEHRFRNNGNALDL